VQYAAASESRSFDTAPDSPAATDEWEKACGRCAQDDTLAIRSCFDPANQEAGNLRTALLTDNRPPDN